MLPPVAPGQGLTADRLNALIDRLNRAAGLTVASPLEIAHHNGRPQLRLAGGPIWARLLTRSGAAYTWREVLPDRDGKWQDTKREGDKGFEANGRAAALGTVVRLWPTVAGDWRFVVGAGGYPYGDDEGGGGRVTTVRWSQTTYRYSCNSAGEQVEQAVTRNYRLTGRDLQLVVT